MKISLAWLNVYLDRPVDADEAERLLTSQGFPIEERASQPNGDVMMDVEVTSNRGDCLSHLGVAREICAGSGRSLIVPENEVSESGEWPASAVKLSVDDPEGCPYYTARVIRGVKVGPSPQWLRERLEAIGLRSVNNIVDITNYVLMKTGQPLHAFDLTMLAGPEIRVRRAKKGETIKAIDGSEHELSESMLVIADAERPCAVAGVMGGLESEVTEKTEDILLEAAIFEPLTVRSTSRALKLASDSSFRFERRVDPRGVSWASLRATQLILELAGGSLSAGELAVGQPDMEPTTLSLRGDRCRTLLGMDLSDQQQADYLNKLGFEPHVSEGVIRCTIPTYRFDLTREVDLIEEVARLHGMDAIPVTEKISLVARAEEARVTARKLIGTCLEGQGFHETVTPSLSEPAEAEVLLPDGGSLIQLEGQRRTDRALRPSLLASLLHCRKINQDHGNHGVRLFEAAAVWWSTPEGKQERRRLGLLMDAEDPAESLRVLKGAIAELIEALAGSGADELAFAEADLRGYEPGARVLLGERELGQFGLASKKLTDHFDLQNRVVLAELDLDVLLDLYPPAYSAAVPPRMPGIERDLSVIVDESVAWSAIEGVIDGVSPERMERLDFLGIYRGKPVPKGRKSLSLRMLFRDPEQTLRHDAVDGEVDAVVAALTQKVGAELRV
ncbi:phenylalanine--tRNA ligase subunit beta [Mucisphaera calidilacus]|uniref:Phenylalanine--tRNA ligase beta subunit n=1 Tax=Mucisphaera calidilacus TaxID=2527982 RepID=A0A518BXF5_9BACT|nr:phenylalanine--tRNA ligase subunit beta [Mucisphaera calidilacus]QDU71634.1 Phenylalanine--tRNA ligase beta subunit [Mucisphaera calidilacus]